MAELRVVWLFSVVLSTPPLTPAATHPQKGLHFNSEHNECGKSKTSPAQARQRRRHHDEAPLKMDATANVNMGRFERQIGVGGG